MDESQVRAVHGFAGKVVGGPLDGAMVTVVAWQPSDEEIDQLAGGHPIFITMMGSLAPHFVTTSFKDATGL